VTITNNGSAPVNGWTLVFSFPGAQTVNSMWNAVSTQSGKQITAKNADWDAAIAAGGSVNFGFNGNSTAGTNGVPTSFTLNGTACTIS